MSATPVSVTYFDPLTEQPPLSSFTGATDAVNGNSFVNRPGTRVYLRNTTGTDVTATFLANAVTIRPGGGRYGDVLNPNLVVTVPATTGLYEVVLPPGRFNGAGDIATVTFNRAGAYILVLKED